MNETSKVTELEQVAQKARARVAATLKTSVERELLAGEPAIMAFDRVDHHVLKEQEKANGDGALAASLWGADGDERTRRFAEKLSSLKAA